MSHMYQVGASRFMPNFLKSAFVFAILTCKLCSFAEIYFYIFFRNPVHTYPSHRTHAPTQDTNTNLTATFTMYRTPHLQPNRRSSSHRIMVSSSFTKGLLSSGFTVCTPNSPCLNITSNQVVIFHMNLVEITVLWRRGFLAFG